ncbi:MAG: AI-2E family transporter [Hoeflea sp.]|uniref:AI-2E family transporter n=1 Tax=Hoeflea sp. TaxID=1940281 RepID=UPI002730C8D8|nr:AI-2E family transporter [Hoeflea sp.]MDP2121872.1 AI-2E family transporter [Hoeflea sp.]MDP3526216.1 AI-2E family transporter [Hoeflea sp.]MDZ7602701.1 AI-2E family transporter [Hoeflea sp.]
MKHMYRLEPPVVRIAARSGMDASLQSISRISIIVIGLVIAFAALDQARSLLAPISLAIITGLMASPVAAALERYIPPALSAAIVVLLFLGLIASALTLFSMPLSIWMERLPEIWREMQRHLLDWRTVFETLGGVQEQIRSISGGKAQMTVEIEDNSTVQDIATLAPALVAQIILFLASLYFFLATRHSMRVSVLSLCFSRRSRLRTARMFRDAEWFVSRYLLSITVINAGLGLSTAAVMWLLGVPQPYLWGMLAFLLNYVVYIGPAVMAGILLGVGLATWDSPPAIFMPMLAYLTLNMFEAQFVTPQVIGRSVTLSPFLVFLSLAFWIWLWGPIGGLLAVPFLLIGHAVMRNSFLMNPPRPNPTVREPASPSS